MTTNATPINFPPRPGDRVARIKASERSAGDCMRVAVAVAYDVPYSETPNPPIGDPEAFWAAWKAWPATRGLEWWQSQSTAPVHLPRWIAAVDAPVAPELRDRVAALGIRQFHAVPMAGDRLIVDPARSQGEGRNYYSKITSTDVRGAMALIPAGSEMPDGDCWQIQPQTRRVRLRTSKEGN